MPPNAIAVRPPVPYFGGKQTIADWIAGHFPAHGHYVEPFGGGLSVLLAKPPSRMETVNDLDGKLMTWWRVLRDRPAELARVCALTPHARGELEAAIEEATDELETARRVWVQLTQSRSATLRRTGWRNYVHPGSSSIGMPGYLDGYMDRFAAAAERLHHVSLECRPALDVIGTYGASPDVLLYVDPPYLGSTRARNYRHEMRTDTEHHELAEALRACRASVVLSGYPSALYEELYADWVRIRRTTRTDNARTNAERTEVLWSNRDLATQPTLFDTFPTPKGDRP